MENPVYLQVCPSCGKGFVVPLYDYTKEGHAVFIKGWTCTHCNDNRILHYGELYTRELLAGELKKKEDLASSEGKAPLVDGRWR